MSRDKFDNGTMNLQIQEASNTSFCPKSCEAIDKKIPGAKSILPAGAPRNLTVSVLSLAPLYHEVQFNVSWLPPTGVPATSYSLTVTGVTPTKACKTHMCYEQGIEKTWMLMPQTLNIVAGAGCVIHPGCAYLVRVNAHPYDGETNANLTMQLSECEAGVCSCAYSRYLPVPKVTARLQYIDGDVFSDLSLTLDPPSEPQMLPAKLGKQSYSITLRKPFNNKWASNLDEGSSYLVNTSGLVIEGDRIHSRRINITRETALNVKLFAEVKLLDNRGCLGPLSEYVMVFDPAQAKSKLSLVVYAILGALIGAWAMAAVFVLSARVVKRVLKSFRPAPVSAPLEPLRRRPAWFPLRLRG